MEHNSYKTAMKRKELSTPMRYLVEEGLLLGRILDYGCGHGDDADALGIEKYDPYHFPAELEGKFNTITCIYVLNTLPDEDERWEVTHKVRNLLAPYGKAYIAVRNDKRNLNGWTQRKTWQGHIELKLPILHKTQNYIIYELK